EELGVELAAQQLKHLGSFTTQAANEADTQLFSRVYTALLPSSETVTAQAEIVELLWVVPGAVTLSPGTRLAPLASMILGQVADAPRYGPYFQALNHEPIPPVSDFAAK